MGRRTDRNGTLVTSWWIMDKARMNALDSPMGRSIENSPLLIPVSPKTWLDQALELEFFFYPRKYCRAIHIYFALEVQS